MPLPGNANRIVVRGRWYAERSGGGVGLPIAFAPVPLAGTAAPNVTDLTAYSWIKTQAASVTPDPVTAFYAVALLSNNDPDLTAFGGWRVTPQGETPFTIDVPYDAPLVPVDADLHAAIPELVVGEQVQAIWMTEAALVGVSPPTPVTSFYTAEQTRSVVASGITAHNADGQAHPDIRALAGSGGAGGATTYTHTQSSAAATWLITHNLGRRPQVTVVDPAGARVIPDLAYPSLNTVTVVHAAPVTGAAYLS